MPGNSNAKGYHTLTPYLHVFGAASLIEFIKNAFGAEETDRMSLQDGVVMHAELKIGDSMIMLSEATGKSKPMPAMIYIYVNDVDTTFKRAIELGAVSVKEPRNEFYGDRTGGVKDPTGNQWWIATHIEDLTREELHKREEEFMKQNH
jgi:PhnB protein